MVKNKTLRNMVCILFILLVCSCIFISTTIATQYTASLDISEYIVFDLYYGDVTITDSTYSGWVYNGTGQPKQVTNGVHSASNKYYVFQSKGEVLSGIPEYSVISNWSDYITDNSDVKSVINEWNKRATERKVTNNIVLVSGSSTYNITIDDIWACDNEHLFSASRESGGIGFNATQNGKMVLTLVGDNRVDRVHYRAKKESGANLIINGTGTLTAAAASTNTQYNESDKNYKGENFWCSAIGGDDSSNGGSAGIQIDSGVIYAGTTYEDNCTAIGGGGNDFGGIVINGGTVTAVASTSGSAIGGGIGYHSSGGDAHVTINGGNVYAYNHGTKQKATRLEGEEATSYVVPAVAIGGGSSIEADGNTETIITINDGTVYAQSIHGVAIGGGGSALGNGGDATVTIKGGHVTAISKAGSIDNTTVNAGASIGGGTGMLSGGSATIRIGNSETHVGPTILTGSIGGGKANTEGATVGYADVEIHGGTIHGQVVMAKGGAQDCKFLMTGGLIDNNNNEDVYWVTENPSVKKTYAFLEGNGDAVSVLNGSATMTGGTIRNCKNILRQSGVGAGGGAIFVNNGTFVMNGGTIEKCDGHNGGAVLVKNGTVTIDGSNANEENIPKVQNNTAIDGAGVMAWGSDSDITVKNAIIQGNIASSQGGGIYAYAGGSITLGEDAKVIYNSATKNGGGAITSGGGNGNILVEGATISNNTAVNGAGASVSNGNFTMTSGKISENNATTNGGAVYINGGNFLITSGEITYNTAANEGGAVYANGGSIVIGIEGCTTDSSKHEAPNTHPNVTGNVAVYGGGGFITDGTMTMYCGTLINNSSNNAGTGDNIYMNGGTFELAGGSVGEETNPGIVLVGGELKDTREEESEENKITMVYHSCLETGENHEVSVTIGKYVNVPAAQTGWTKDGYTMVGWTTIPNAIVRKFDDYKSVGMAIKVEDTDGDKEIHYYAVWAKTTGSITYELDGGIVPGTNVTSYDYSVILQGIQLISPEKTYYTFTGWELTASEDTITNWETYYPENEESVFYSVENPEEGLDLNIGTHFGDITLTAIYEPIVVNLEITINNNLEPNQSYILELSGTPSNENNFITQKIAIITDEEGKGTITIKGIKVGTYTVNLKNSWSWRYELVEENILNTTNMKIDNSKETHTITFDGFIIKNNFWLNGYDYYIKR